MKTQNQKEMINKQANDAYNRVSSQISRPDAFFLDAQAVITTFTCRPTADQYQGDRAKFGGRAIRKYHKDHFLAFREGSAKALNQVCGEKDGYTLLFETLRRSSKEAEEAFVEILGTKECPLPHPQTKNRYQMWMDDNPRPAEDVAPVAVANDISEEIAPREVAKTPTHKTVSTLQDSASVDSANSVARIVKSYRNLLSDPDAVLGMEDMGRTVLIANVQDNKEEKYRSSGRSSMIRSVLNRQIKLHHDALANVLTSDFDGKTGYARLFEAVRRGGNEAEDLFVTLCNHKLFMLPERTKRVHKLWLIDNPRPVEEAEEAVSVVVEQTAETVLPEEPAAVTQQEVPPVEERVLDVEVAEPFITVGADGDMLPLEGEREEKPAQERIAVSHENYIVNAMVRHFDLNDKPTRYHAPRDQQSDEDYSYKLLEFTEKNGRTHHVVTSDWYGSMTCVIKDMEGIDPNAPHKINLSELIHAGKAWSVRCVNENQYAGRIVELCKTDIADLTPQRPHMSWRNQKQAAIDALRGHMLETGQTPKTGDQSLIRHGALAGKNLYANLYNALNKGSIKGLEFYKDFYQLMDAVEEKYPGTIDHLDKPVIDARKLYEDVLRFEKAEGLPPQSGWVDALGWTLAGLSEGELSEYFSGTTKGGVIHLQDVLLPEFRGKAVNSLEDYVVATGLGVSNPRGTIELPPQERHNDAV